MSEQSRPANYAQIIRNMTGAILTASAVAYGSATLLAASCTSGTCGGCVMEAINCMSCWADSCSAGGFACAQTCRTCNGGAPECSS
jgi:hypothetical protein